MLVQVGPTQIALDIYFTWPKAIPDVNLLHKFWLEKNEKERIEPYHPRVVGFRNFFRSYRVREFESIVTTSRLRLQTKVETEVVKNG